MNKFDYKWKSYKAVTKDKWELTLFRITGPEDTIYGKNKPPILFMHGNANDATSWMRNQNEKGKSIFLEFYDKGYDVWLGNNRGTRYSNVYQLDDTVSE